MPTSAEFWDLARVRLEDAEGLLGIGRWASPITSLATRWSAP